MSTTRTRPKVLACHCASEFVHFQFNHALKGNFTPLVLLCASTTPFISTPLPPSQPAAKFQGFIDEVKAGTFTLDRSMPIFVAALRPYMAGVTHIGLLCTEFGLLFEQVAHQAHVTFDQMFVQSTAEFGNALVPPRQIAYINSEAVFAESAAQVMAHGAGEFRNTISSCNSHCIIMNAQCCAGEVCRSFKCVPGNGLAH